MDEFLIRFIHELGANLALAKNFFFFVETLAKGLSRMQTGTSSDFSMMTWLAFWNGVAQYFFGLYGKKGERTFAGLFAHLDRHPELVPSSKAGYYRAVSARARTRWQSDRPTHYGMERMFDDIVFANEMYVNLCNLYDIRSDGQPLSSVESVHRVQ
ncbi:MAG: hypothetical protein WC509_07255 [Candidatus Izemoplasmatales bacterium]